MLEKDKMVELLKKDIEAHNRVKRKLSIQLEQRQRELREFMVIYYQNLRRMHSHHIIFLIHKNHILRYQDL